jgi:competence protein ComEC
MHLNFIRTILSAWLVAGLGLCAGFALTPAAWAQQTQNMRVHVIDVGQGSATLIEFPCAAMLVDTGGESNREFHSTEELQDYLDAFFARRSDLNRTFHSLVLTHPHIDHTRGVTTVLSRYRVRNAITNGWTARASGSGGQNKLHRTISRAEESANPNDNIGFAEARLAAIPRGQGLTNAIIDPIACPAIDPKITLLWGRLETNPPWTQKTFKNQNNHSAIVRIDFGAASYLITGDLEDHAIARLVAHYRGSQVLDVDVYQVGHHGSHNGTTDALLRALTPKIAVIAMGEPERRIDWTAWDYGHPRKTIVDMLHRHVSATRTPVDVMVAPAAKRFQSQRVTKAIYGTGWDGNIILEADADGTWRVNPETPAPVPTSSRLNVNIASAPELSALPAIGETRARAIVDYRTQSGPFASVEDLVRVRGIGPATLTLIRDRVTTGTTAR